MFVYIISGNFGKRFHPKTESTKRRFCGENWFQGAPKSIFEYFKPPSNVARFIPKTYRPLGYH